MGPKVLIHGAGAVGAFLGWRLAAGGFNVTVCCRSNYEVVKKSGFIIRSQARGDGSYRPRAVRHPSELASEAFKYVFVATKIPAGNDSAVRALSSVVGPETTLCSAQNGVSADSALANAFPNNNVLSAVCYTSVQQEVPGIIVQETCIRPYEFGLGVHKGGKQAEVALKRLVQLDNTFDHAAGGAEQARWEKMIFNAAWNPACALLGLDSLQMSKHPLGLTLVKALADEAYQVALACGITLDPAVVDHTVSWASRYPDHIFVPSMLRDVIAKKPVEVEALCSSLVQLAQRYQVAVSTVLAVERLLCSRNEALHAERIRSEPSYLEQAQRLVPEPLFGLAVGGL